MCELNGWRFSPGSVAALAAAAILFGLTCAGPAAADPLALPRSLQRAEARPANLPGAVQVSPAMAPTLAPAPPRPRVYLFRGAMGLIFSRGMDALAAKLRRAGVTANVYEFTLCHLVSSAAIDNYRRDPAPFVLIGHSMGGRCALQFADELKDAGIPASLVVTIDPAHLSPDVPSNVERFINIYLSKDILGGGDIQPAADFHGYYASYDLAKHGEISHITIDKVDAIHQQLVDKIVQLAAAPATEQGEIVPLRYVVPPKTDIELWDAGMAVAARAGDTLQTIAVQNQLPLWSLGQMNRFSEDALLAEGERVVVPFHLTPAPVPGLVSSRR